MSTAPAPVRQAGPTRRCQALLAATQRGNAIVRYVEVRKKAEKDHGGGVRFDDANIIHLYSWRAAVAKTYAYAALPLCRWCGNGYLACGRAYQHLIHGHCRQLITTPIGTDVQ